MSIVGKDKVVVVKYKNPDEDGNDSKSDKGDF